MVHDGIGKVMQGMTTPEEVFRVAKSITEDD
jgi:type II secretory ATPase GspE/PulE/Tfp pilus assembly ATPase PilB-like protein